MREIKQQKADWLRSEIEKLEDMKQKIPHDDKYRPETEEEAYHLASRFGYNQALTSIITRYKEELLELEKQP